ncbi:MAG: PD-(D/E)XK nuclease domain-containing protein, partial [Bacteroidota bacterium]
PDEIRNWYNGYTFGDQVVYNPWSVMCCLETGGVLDCYWIDSGGTKLIDSVLLSDEIQHKLQALISGQSITSTIEKHISFDALAEPDTEPLYSLLLFGGYLNPGAALPGLDSNTYQLSIPNHEVRYIYKRRLLEWVRKKLKINSDQYRDLVMLLATGQVESFTEQLQNLLSQSTSFHQVGPQRSEVFYSGFMFGLLNILSNHYIMESERESGLGRPDAVLIPRVEYGDCALIIEYKVCKQVEQLATLAASGLAQIVDKAYSTQLKSHSHIKKVLQVGLAFCGKQVASKYEQVDL